MHRHLRLTSAWLVGCAVALTGLASPQPGRSADNPVKDVTYAKHGDAFELALTANGPVTTRIRRFSVDAKHDIQDLVVDVSPASYEGLTKVVGFSKGQLQQVRVGQLSTSPAIMRIVVEAVGTPSYHLTPAGNGLKLDVQTNQVAFTLPASEAVAAARNATQRHDEALDGADGSAMVASTSKLPLNTRPATQPKMVAVHVATLHTEKAASAKSSAPAVKTQSAPVKIQSAPVKTQSTPVKTVALVSHPAPPAPKPAPKPEAKPATVSHVATPAVVAMATPNPWLPRGKYYCKVPSRHSAAGAAMASNETAHRQAAALAAPPPPPSDMSGMTSPRNVNLDVKNADILDVLKLLANESGENIVATQNVKGTVTVSLHDVPLRTALDLIVHTNGLDYRRMGNIYVVGTTDDLNHQFGSIGQVATQTVAFPIKYANPNDLKTQLAGVIPSSAFTIDARTDTVLVSGTPDIIQSARNFLALSDVPAPQVVFEVKVLDITRNNDQTNTGVQFVGSSDFDLFENRLAGPESIQVPVQVVNGNPIAPQPFTRNAVFIQAKINYLISHNEAQLLANPRVTALDNQTASLLVGQTYPIVYYDPRSGQFQVQYIDIGVKLI